MKLRKLQQKDAELMLEWMHDEKVIGNMQAEKFRNKTIDDCRAFIELAQDTSEDCNLAIVDDEDTYMGTVSLKHINHEYRDAEFAICVRSAAQGKGFGSFALRDIIRIAFEEYDLDEVYWNVLAGNTAAMYLYNKYEPLTEVSDRRMAPYIEAAKSKQFKWFVARR